MNTLKALFAVGVVALAIFAANTLTGGGLFTLFQKDWRAPSGGDVGSQAICQDSCSCRTDEHCVEGTCRKWGCKVTSIGRGGCPEHSKCDKVDGVPVCVRLLTDPKCN